MSKLDGKPPATHRPPSRPAGRKRFAPPWPEESGRSTVVDFGLPEVVRAALRLSSVMVALGVIAAATAIVSLFFDPGSVQPRAAGFRRICYSLMLTALGIHLKTRLKPPRTAVLYVANHPSWLDGLVVGAATGTSSVAYPRDWPLIGWLMRCFGTVMIPRGQSSSLPGAVSAVAGRLRAGGAVAVFPEGDTSFGPGVLPFKPAFFQSAVDAHAEIVAVSIRYRTPPPYPSPDRSVHWVDWTPILVHAARLAAMRGVEVRLEMASELAPVHNRKELAAQAEAMVVAMLENLK